MGYVLTFAGGALFGWLVLPFLTGWAWWGGPSKDDDDTDDEEGTP